MTAFEARSGVGEPPALPRVREPAPPARALVRRVLRRARGLPVGAACCSPPRPSTACSSSGRRSRSGSPSSFFGRRSKWAARYFRYRSRRGPPAGPARHDAPGGIGGASARRVARGSASRWRRTGEDRSTGAHTSPVTCRGRDGILQPDEVEGRARNGACGDGRRRPGARDHRSFARVPVACQTRLQSGSTSGFFRLFHRRTANAKAQDRHGGTSCPDRRRDRDAGLGRHDDRAG